MGNDETYNGNFYNEKMIINSLREYKREEALRANMVGLFNEIRIICEAARAAGFDEQFAQSLGLNLALSAITAVPPAK